MKETNYKPMSFLLLLAISIFIALLGCGEIIDTVLSGDQSVTLTWDAPTKNANGTTLTDLAGYRVYFGLNSKNYDYQFNVTGTTTSTIDNLTEGRWYFAVRAFDQVRNYSVYSEEAIVNVVKN